MPPITIYKTHPSTSPTLTELQADVDNLDAVSTQVAHGVYAVFRTYTGGTTFRLDAHLNRMRNSAALLNNPFPLTNAEIREALAQAYSLSGIPMPRFKITVPHSEPDALVIALEPFTPPPPDVYANGVIVGLAAYTRQQATVKDSRFIEDRDEIKSGAGQDAYEVILYDPQGNILEGTSSNFYAALNGELYTANRDVLEGIARSVLIEVAPLVLPLRLEPLHISQLSSITEAMLTSSSRGVVPINQIGEHIVGDGTPGPLAKQLANAYDARITSELEPFTP